MTFFDSVVFHNIVEELTAARVFHDQVELFGGLDDLSIRVGLPHRAG